MAKDRARDPKRVPSLGISEPTSHVKIKPAPKKGQYLRNPMRDEKVKVDAFRNSDAFRDWKSRSHIEDLEIEEAASREGALPRIPVIKINSGK
jgi:hypothetical protein